MNGVVGLAVFVIVMFLAYVIAGLGYACGWWMRDTPSRDVLWAQALREYPADPATRGERYHELLSEHGYTGRRR